MQLAHTNTLADQVAATELITILDLTELLEP